MYQRLVPKHLDSHTGQNSKNEEKRKKPPGTAAGVGSGGRRIGCSPREEYINLRLKLGFQNIRKLVGGVGFQAEYPAEILCKVFVHAAFQPFYYHAEEKTFVIAYN